jgi:hypothetical protein
MPSAPALERGGRQDHLVDGGHGARPSQHDIEPRRGHGELQDHLDEAAASETGHKALEDIEFDFA